MESTCRACKAKVEEWNEECGSCGFRLVMEPEERVRARFLRGPAVGALLFTQGWAFGARLYVWFLLSLIPIVGLVVLFVLLLAGRRLSWKSGGWGSWEEFRSRMKMLDLLAAAWFLMLIVVYVVLRREVGT
jgi:hypothetical protein